jgi:hypothetical protein
MAAANTQHRRKIPLNRTLPLAHAFLARVSPLAAIFFLESDETSPDGLRHPGAPVPFPLNVIISLMRTPGLARYRQDSPSRTNNRSSG